MNNIDRISATTIPEDFHVNVTVLNELIRIVEMAFLVCRLELSLSFSKDDILKLIASLCTS